MVAIFVALMFVGLVLTDLLVQRIEARPGEATLRLAGVAIPGMPGEVSAAATRWDIPEGVCIAGGHSWLRPAVHAGFAVGADELVSYAVGSVTGVIPPRVGVRIKKGDPLFHLAFAGGVISITAPIGGKVIAVNGDLEKRPSLVTEQPYSEGWVCSVLPDRPENPLSGVLAGSRAAMWLEREFRRLSDFISNQATYDLALGATSPDGGLAASGCLAYLDPGVSAEFQAQFLRS